VEMALVFLAPVIEDEHLTKHHNKLRICFKDFLKKFALLSSPSWQTTAETDCVV